MPPFQGALFNLNLLYMSATVGAAAITAGAGLLGSLFGSKKQDKNAQAQREWQEKMYLMDRDYNTAANQRKRFEGAGLNPNLLTQFRRRKQIRLTQIGLLVWRGLISIAFRQAQAAAVIMPLAQDVRDQVAVQIILVMVVVMVVMVVVAVVDIAAITFRSGISTWLVGESKCLIRHPKNYKTST